MANPASNSTDEWGTPQALFDKLNSEFSFVLDVCATPSLAKCQRFFTPKHDGLKQNWYTEGCRFVESVWMNPPYGRGIESWVEKAHQQGSLGLRVVCLLPSRTNAPWWHEHVMKAQEIRFIRKKVPFEGPVKGVPFWGSAIVVFGPEIGSSPRFSSYDYRPPRNKPTSSVVQ